MRFLGWKKTVVGLLGCFALVFSLVAWPMIALADQATATAEAAAGAATGACPGLAPCPPLGVLRSLQTVNDKIIEPTLGVVIQGVFMNAIQFIANRLAYDTALWLSSGDKGQAPLFQSETGVEAWQNFGLDVLGDTLGIIDEQVSDKSFGAFGQENVKGEFETTVITNPDGTKTYQQTNKTKDKFPLKFSLCRPPDPLVNLAISVGLKAAYQRPTPRCDLSNLPQNLEALKAKFSTAATAFGANPTGEAMKALSGFMRPGVNELSVAVQLNIQVNEEVNRKRTLSTNEINAQGGFKAVTDIITGQVKTPAAFVYEQSKSTIVDKQGKEQEAFTYTANNPEWGKWGVAAALSVAATFANTFLTGGITQRIYDGLFAPPPPIDPFAPEALSSSNREAAAARFASLQATQPISISNYDALSEFVVCPVGNVLTRNVNNCVIDQNFVSAISRASSGSPMTVQEAINEGLINGDLPLIPPTDKAKNQDPLCYTRGWCYGNLVKLRRARVIPVGWEMAAEVSSPDHPKTLQEAINEFNNCNPLTNSSDSLHPWCHLVDPNWILKYPQSQCRANVNGEVLATLNSGGRASVCADAPSCISENEKGACEGYGYCTREKNTWKFSGDSCPAQFATCLSFTNTSTNKPVNFLLNTVDYASCNDKNAGCRWYATTQTATGAWNSTPRIYFNGTVEACSAAEDGCSALVQTASTRLNLVQNASFENDVNGDTVPDFWAWAAAPIATDYVDGGFQGTGKAVRPSSPLTQLGIALAPNTFYTLSAYVKSTGAAAGPGISLALRKAVQTVPSTPLNLIGTSHSTSTCDLVNGTTYRLKEFVGPEYARVSCTFTTAADALLADLSLEGGNVTYDFLQIEIGENPTQFLDGGYSASQPATSYIRVAPAYLGCTGAATDAAACAQYAQSCSAQDVGCSDYFPTDGDPKIPALVTDLDRCPSACVGYATFRQEASRYEPAKFPLAFIPSTARACSANDVGCDSFTNLDTVAQGGEAVEHYTNLRACSLPGELRPLKGSSLDESSTYFTWEGSDAAGFQLRTWQLLKSNFSAAPCTAWQVQDPANPVMHCIDTNDTAPAGCAVHADIFRNGDCREFYDEAGAVHFRYFSETVTVSEQCKPYRKTTSTQDDCTQTGGLWTPAGECRYLGLTSESNSCSAAANGCREYTGGGGRNLRTVLSQDFELASSITGLTSVNGATITHSNESTATTGHSMSVTTAAQNAGFSGSLTGVISANKTLSLNFWAKGSGSLRVALVEQNGVAHDFVNPANQNDALDDLVLDTSWRLYTLGPLDTSDKTKFPNFTDVGTSVRVTANTPGAFFIDNVALQQAEDVVTLIKNSWVTPAACDTSPTGAAAPQYYVGCKEYKDSNSATQNLYQFTRLCSEKAVGCQGFYNTQASASPYAAAYNLRCEKTSPAVASGACVVRGVTYCTIGQGQDYCLFNLSNGQTDQPIRVPSPLPLIDGSFRIAQGPEAQLVKNDAPVYLVNDGSAVCSAQSVGCQALGAPKFNQANTAVASYETRYLRNLPDSYSDQLCDDTALFCDAWSTLKDGKYFFKDPGEQQCEFKTGVRIGAGETYDGWFRVVDPTSATPTVAPCYGNNLVSGQQYGIWKNGDQNYEGWVGKCEAKYDQCTEFIDPTDASSASAKGKSYYFVKNDRLGAASATSASNCEGQVSQKAGCALFNSSAVLGLPYSAGPSYIASTHADILYGKAANSKQTPISCGPVELGLVNKVDGTSVNLCKLRCVYNVGNVDTNLKAATSLEILDAVGLPTSSEIFGSCLTNTDCPSLETTRNTAANGTCVNIDSASFAVPADQRSRYYAFNDTNSVLNVGRDRQCSEWLACTSGKPSWNSRTAKYEQICDKVELCSALGTSESSSCARIVTGSNQVLTTEAYTSRDTSWSGFEYSGYTIPNQVPIQALQQVNVNPLRWCVDTATKLPVKNTNGFEVTCGTRDNCPDPTKQTCESPLADYRLARVVGSCNEETVGRGGTCSIGVCKNNPETACSNNTECPSGDVCTIGYCVEGVICQSDAGCTTPGTMCDPVYHRCVDLARSYRNTSCSSIGTSCGNNGICALAGSTNKGTCLNNRCLTDIDGDQFTPTNAESASCRGYPEADSPYPSSIVLEWTKVDSSKRLTEASTPLTYRSGFNSVNVISPFVKNGTYTSVNDTAQLCSYSKARYGQSNIVRYYPEKLSSIPQKMCVGGDKEGISCDGQGLTVCEAADGKCQELTRQESLVGWTGYCLERDTSVQLFGSVDQQQACLTWLPVDQLAGSTDLYGKFTSAGFSPEETLYCADIEKYFDIQTSSIACAETWGAWCSGTPISDTDWTNKEDCWKSVACPSGYFAVMSSCGDAAPAGDAGKMCPATWIGDEDDCPFFCVPKLSFRADNTECKPPEGTKFIENKTDVDGFGPRTKNPIKIYLAAADKFKALHDSYLGCAVKGLSPQELYQLYKPDFLTTPDMLTIEFFETRGYRNLDLPVQSYLACKTLAQVGTKNLPETSSVPGSGLSSYNIAWTDRLWKSNPTPYVIKNPSGAGPIEMAYTESTQPSPFGAATALESYEKIPAFAKDSRPESTVVCTKGKFQRMPAVDGTCPAGYALQGPSSRFEYARLYQKAENLCTPNVWKDEDGDPYGDPFDCLLRIVTSSGKRTINSFQCGEPILSKGVIIRVQEGNEWEDHTVFDDGIRAIGPYERGFSYSAADARFCRFKVGADPENITMDCTNPTATEICIDVTSTGGDLSVCYTPVCPYGTDVLTDEEPNDAKFRLKQIFAAPIGLYQWVNQINGFRFEIPTTSPEGLWSEYANVQKSASDPANWSSLGYYKKLPGLEASDVYFDETSTLNWSWNALAVGDSQKQPKAPTVYAVGDCRDSLCEEKRAGAFSVNNLDSGNIIGTNGQKHVSVSFFVSADPDQAPIRRMIVDWGDGSRRASPGMLWPTSSQSGSDAPDNFYQNHRGSDANGNPICGSNTNFGTTTEACDSSYVAFTHDYVCTREMVTSSLTPICQTDPSTGRLINSPCTGGFISDAADRCVFQPRVHVMDNWGWCTGVCKGSSIDGTDGCFNGNQLGPTLNNECNISQCPGGAGCTNSGSTSNQSATLVNPWINFNGYVIVPYPGGR